MDPTNVSHPNVTPAVHLDEANGRALFGAIVDGEFIPFAERKIGGVLKWLRIGRERQQQQQAQQPAPEQQQQG